MNPAISPGQEIFIQRHCMQNLLHEALISDPNTCCGLLTGAGNMIESALSVTNFVNNLNMDMPRPEVAGQPFIGIYLSMHSDHGADRQLLEELSGLYSKLCGRTPDCCLLLDLGQQGRIDATLYSDTSLTRPRSLEMLEDGDLYPLSLSR